MFRRKICCHSLCPGPHWLCRREPAHTSPYSVPFYRFLYLTPSSIKYVQSTLHFRQPFFLLCVSKKPSPLTPLTSIFCFLQLHRPLLAFSYIPTASAIPRPHQVRIFRISPDRLISRHQDSIRTQRSEPSRYPALTIPIFPLSSFDGLPDVG